MFYKLDVEKRRSLDRLKKERSRTFPLVYFDWSSYPPMPWQQTIVKVIDCSCIGTTNISNSIDDLSILFFLKDTKTNRFFVNFFLVREYDAFMLYVFFIEIKVQSSRFILCSCFWHNLKIWFLDQTECYYRKFKTSDISFST